MYDDRSGDPLLQRKGETVSRTCATDIGYTEPRLPHLHRQPVLRLTLRPVG